MKTLSEYIAHPRNAEGARQTLKEHTDNVSAISSAFAKEFGQYELANAIGQAHDLGKTRSLWQDRILRIERIEELHGLLLADPHNTELQSESQCLKLRNKFVEMLHDHKMSVAALVYPHDAYASLIIAGHHQGMPDFAKFKTEMDSGKWDAHREETLQNIGGTFQFKASQSALISETERR